MSLPDRRPDARPPGPSAKTWVWAAVGAIGVAIAVLGGLAIAAQVFEWRDYWKAAAQPYATVLTGLAVLAAAALALYNGERQRTSEQDRWAADQLYRTVEADRQHDREVTRELRSRFTTATEQLANPSPTIRRSGVHALAALADDWYAKGNWAEVIVCFDVLTGYLKTPNADFDEEAHTAGPDGPVRATIVTTLAQRRRSSEHWRGEVVSVEGADLRGVDFTRALLSGADLSRVDLRFADLASTALTGANLTGADLRHAGMIHCDLTNAHLAYATLQEADLLGAMLAGARFYWTDFSRVRFFNANFTRAVGPAKFTDADLSYSTLHQASLGGSTFVRTKVVGADVAGADLSGVTFGSMTVGDFKNLHLAILNDRQREKYGEAMEKCREWADAEARLQAQMEHERGNPDSGCGGA